MKEVKKINPEKWYTPREIIALDVIKDKERKYTYDFLLKAIRNGKLRSKDISLGKKNNKYGVYKVRGLDLIEFIDIYC